MSDRGGPRRSGRAWADDEYDDQRPDSASRRVERRHPVEDRGRDGDFSRGVGGRGSHQPLRAQWDPTARDDSARTRAPRPPRKAKKQSKLGKFTSVYGWRAYAVPILLVVTSLVVFDAVRTGEPTTTASSDIDQPADPGFGALSPSGDSTGVIGVPPAADGNFADSIPSGELPDGGSFTVQGAGTWHVVQGATGQVGQGSERVFTYTVEVEDGVDTAGFGGEESFGRLVDQTLGNPKSWTNDQRFAFRRIDQGEPDFRISLTSQMSIRQACGYDIQLEVSCYNPGIGRVVLNEPRWVRGAIAFQGDIGSYRQYQINHEVGHAIGYQQHQPCETDGGLAPVMMQQTFGTANDDIARLDPEGVVPMDGKTCRFNPWPYPRG
ncbi:DUF3152 domain-containing protein [Rhodococcoides fascians]|uniref:DUF3152 domain-containing protein n=1 Tax=Rhodococcoides fascians TaxID=1828 RepID=UPI00056B627A|nr:MULTISPECIES: DUF3152 domain-containing protein [Rhodococcus]OZF07234.1 DUF3152 domain-containing protein [Rhodococcus sp. 15-1189-1-1a]OZF22758.1 DUF3152 domain-containing protein [Rhodococcus sp. 14-2686-1-2]